MTLNSLAHLRPILFFCRDIRRRLFKHGAILTMFAAPRSPKWFSSAAKSCMGESFIDRSSMTAFAPASPRLLHEMFRDFSNTLQTRRLSHSWSAPRLPRLLLEQSRCCSAAYFKFNRDFMIGIRSGELPVTSRPLMMPARAAACLTPKLIPEIESVSWFFELIKSSIADKPTGAQQKWLHMFL